MDRPLLEGADLSRSLARRAERRAERRTAMSFLPAGMEYQGDERLARCRDISNGGAKLHLNTSVGLNDRIEVAFAPGVTLAARVVWINGNECGVAFDREIDSVALLRALADRMRPEDVRPVRTIVNLPVRVGHDSRDREAEASSDCRSGQKLGHDGGFQAGLHITVLMNGGRECDAVVHWAGENFAGLRFEDPFRVAELRPADCSW